MFRLESKYLPSKEQKRAIDELVKNIKNKEKFQTLWGITGSGKTFTMANVIEKINKPTLIIAHNKTLAAQLAQEFKEFFPNNAVHYFVSYYDYYQPEAYVSKTDTYIEKEATINEEIDRFRHAATRDLLTRTDVIIVASVSCIYGIGEKNSYLEQIFSLEVGKSYEMEELFKQLVSLQYKRAPVNGDFLPGNFQVRGDTLTIYPPSSEDVYSIEFWGDEISDIQLKNKLTGEVYERLSEITIFPAKHTVTTQSRIQEILPNIQKELDERLDFFKEQGDVLRYERLKAKTEYDMEMMQEVGYVNGIENYSRFIDGRKIGEAPTTLIDYFPEDSLTFVDESHMTFSQVGGMYAGDRSRKMNLVENGFRLPSALDNRPLKFDEFEKKIHATIAVSATPALYEISQSMEDSDKFFHYDPVKDGEWISNRDTRVIPKFTRPTGLLDPEIELREMNFMVDDIMKNIDEAVKKNERVLITAITKRSSEELTEYLVDNGIKVKYLHSEVDTIERLEILKELREGVIDVIVGVNLLREGLDLPEVSKICILDADKQGFLRSVSSLIQIIGRAARNENGKVYMYCEKLKNTDIESLEKQYDGLYRLDKGKLVTKEGFIVSEAMRKAINMTYYRRGIQESYNQKHGIIPKTVYSQIKEIGMSKKDDGGKTKNKKMKKEEIKRLELEMDIASANMDFEKAAQIRDELFKIKKNNKVK